MNDKQLCRGCFEDLPLGAFHRNRNTKTGHMNICRSCRSKTRTDYQDLPAMEDRLDNIDLSDILRFTDLIEIDPDSRCWMWIGATKGPYPAFWHRGGRIAGHRFAVIASGRTFELDDQIHHLCGRSLCTNPDHLEPMSAEDHRKVHAEQRRKHTTSRKRLDAFGRSRSKKAGNR